jgi:hypothetical protein
MRIESFGLRIGLHPREIERLKQVAERAYKSAGGPDMTPEALAFFRTQVALAELAREAAALRGIRPPVRLAKHPELAAAVAQANAVFGL